MKNNEILERIEKIEKKQKVFFWLELFKILIYSTFLFSLLYFLWTVWAGFQPTIKLANQMIENSNNMISDAMVTNKQVQNTFPEFLKTNEEAQKLIKDFRATNYQMNKGIRTTNRILHKVEYPVEGITSFNPF